MESNGFIFLVPVATIIGAAIIVKAIIDNWAKMRRKEMGSIESEAIEKNKSLNRYLEMKRLLVNLKWSLILIGIGFPLALSYFIKSMPAEVVLGLMILFAGLGFFIYFLLSKSMLDKSLSKKND